MPSSNMAHQRAQDDSAEIEFRTEELEQEAREVLTRMNRYSYDSLTEYGMLTDDYMTDFDVMEAVDDLSRDEVTLAFTKLDSDPLEAVRILKEARDKAVEHTLGRIDFNNVARAERERAQREEAA
ncbi:hypothetical protein MYE70_10415 [Marinobacter alexandrii]|uniref:hypothetical protein n=1 Tax=Marinobacter alexandrii TaxID=2570351 RepID=UPI001FFEDE6B|nr:hypothetical protein [Marinobacter alexandrii]MCK2149479.1 hypothetical protein [Marinobacter alexandrii]